MLLSLIKIFKIEIIKLLKKLMEGNMKKTCMYKCNGLT